MLPYCDAYHDAYYSELALRMETSGEYGGHVRHEHPIPASWVAIWIASVATVTAVLTAITAVWPN